MRFRLGLPEMLIMFAAMLLLFGSTWGPRILRGAERRGYSLSLVLAFTAFLVMAFIYGFTLIQ